MKKSPLAHLCEKEVYPLNFEKITVKCHEKTDTVLFFDKIYSAFPVISVKCDGRVHVRIESGEIDGNANYGEDIPILCMASNVTPFSFDHIRNACIMIGLKNVSYMGMTTNVHNHTTDLGASAHPNYKGQIKVASNVIPYISSITGWEMEDKLYR